MADLTQTIQSLGSVLNTALTNIDTLIEQEKNKGNCNDSTVTSKADCSNSFFCYDADNDKTIDGKDEENCIGDFKWTERVWTSNTNNKNLDDLTNKRKTIYNAINDTIKNETSTIAQKNALLSQLETVGDNIDANKDYIDKKIKQLKKTNKIIKNY